MSSSSDVTSSPRQLAEKGWEMGTGYIPRPAGAKGGVAIGGGSLWMTNMGTPEQQLAAIKLIEFISSDGPQIQWHKGTGYFPVRKTAMDKLKAEGWFDENPNYLTAFNQLLDSPETLNTAGALLGTFPETRAIVQSAIQECYAGSLYSRRSTKPPRKQMQPLQNGTMYKAVTYHPVSGLPFTGAASVPICCAERRLYETVNLQRDLCPTFFFYRRL